MSLSTEKYGKVVTLTHCGVHENILGFARHLLEFFAGRLIEVNSSSSPDVLKIRWTCPTSLENFAFTGFRERENM